jgi:hypothetical protein
MIKEIKTIYFKILYLILLNSFFSGCGINKIDFKNSEEEDKTISYVNKTSPNDRSSYTFNPKDGKSIALIFKEKFKDTIEVSVNNKRCFKFYKNDFPIIESDGQVNTITSGKNTEIFKSISLKKRANNQVIILLKNAKKKVSFTLEKDKKLYVISYFKNHWYITYMN